LVGGGLLSAPLWILDSSLFSGLGADGSLYLMVEHCLTYIYALHLDPP
jgi:hypothetical protein